MTLRLTPKQYRTLIKMAWIASRVAQGSEVQESDTVEQILEITDYLCTQAPQFGADEMFEAVLPEEVPDGDFSVGDLPPMTVRLKAELEDELMSIIEWFEEYSFWDIIEDRLAMRDISEERTEAQWTWLPEAEKDRIYNKYLEYYFEEFSESGISNLRLVPPDPGKPRVPLGWGDGSGTPGPGPEGPGGPHAPGSGAGGKPHRPAKIIEFPTGPRPGPDGDPPRKPR